MGYEVTAIISGIFFIVGIIILQLFWERKYKFNLDFEKFKIKERKKAVKDKYKLQVKNPAPKDINFWLSKIKDLNPDVIANILDAIGEGNAEEKENLFDSLGEGIGDFISNNPKLVQGFLNKYIGKENETNEDIYSNR